METFFLKRDPSKAIILTGSGRSGTTWVGNIIAANPYMRIIFEPFDHRRVPLSSCFPKYPYDHPDKVYPDWKPIVEKILSGQVNNQWVNRQGYRWWANRL